MEPDKIIIIINFALQIIQMIDHSCMKRLKKSSCCGFNLELNNNEDKKDNNDIEKNNNKI